MRPDPWIVTLSLLLAGVMAFGTTMISRHREARRLRSLPLPVEESEPLPQLRWRPPAVPAVAPPRPEPPPPEPVPATGVLRFSVIGPHGLRPSSVGMRAVPHGEAPREDQENLEAFEDHPGEDGTVSTGPLPPGRYDVTVGVMGMRSVRLEGLPVNGEPVAVTLDREPVLTGAVRREPSGEKDCHYVAVVLEGRESHRSKVLIDENDCTFRIEDLPPAGPISLRALAVGRQERFLVNVPLTGDPPFLCLAPPCGAPPTSVVVYVADTRGVLVEEAGIAWELQADETHGELGTTSGSSPITLPGRHTGETLHLTATAGGGSAETTLVVGSGVTEVVLTVPAVEAAEEEEEGEEVVTHLR